MRRKRVFALGLATAALCACVVTGAASADHGPQPQFHWHPPHSSPLAAVPDGYSTGSQATLAVDSSHGVLANDHGDEPTLVANTEPSRMPSTSTRRICRRSAPSAASP